MLIPHPARHEDIDGILTVVAHARAALAELGIDQWQDGYPERAVIEADVASGIGWVFRGSFAPILGYMALAPSPEAVYADIDGAWRTDGDYLTVHRLCLDDGWRGQGFGEKLLDCAEMRARTLGIPALRADTHRGNIPMQRLLEKRGFIRCGTVTYPVTAGDPLRVAYEKPLDVAARR